MWRSRSRTAALQSAVASLCQSAKASADVDSLVAPARLFAGVTSGYWMARPGSSRVRRASGLHARPVVTLRVCACTTQPCASHAA